MFVTIVILACLLAIALVAFTLKAGLAMSWLYTAIGTVLFAAFLVATVLYLLGAAVRDHLIDDVGTLYKRWSTRIAGIQFTGVIAWWALVPAELKAVVPNWVLQGALAAFALSFVAAQSVKQKNLTPPEGGA